MATIKTITAFTALFYLLVLININKSQAHDYGKGFFNHTGCLYAYTEGGTFEMITLNGNVINEKLELDELSFDSRKSRCVQEGKTGKLVFSFDLNEESKLKSITLSFRILSTPLDGFWSISQANLTVAKLDQRQKIFPLDISETHYAGSGYSYSCKEFVLETIRKNKPDNETDKYEPSALVTLNRFQLQPFPEPERTVFADSFDCTVFFTREGYTALIAFSIIAVFYLLGVLAWTKFEPNDFKFTKESLIYTQSQMDTNRNRQ